MSINWPPKKEKNNVLSCPSCSAIIAPLDPAMLKGLVPVPVQGHTEIHMSVLVPGNERQRRHHRPVGMVGNKRLAKQEERHMMIPL